MGWLFGGRVQRDGAAASIEAGITGLPPAILDAPEPRTGRRERALATEQQVLVDAVAEKILHGWLQNRHQTLFPLTVNLRSLSAGQGAALVRWTAVAALAGRPSDAAHAVVREWLASAGADAGLLELLAGALDEPPPLHAALQEVSSEGIAAYAYVAALIAADMRDPASAHFLDYVAARLALPSTVVRSAMRRYRR